MTPRPPQLQIRPCSCPQYLTLHCADNLEQLNRIKWGMKRYESRSRYKCCNLNFINFKKNLISSTSFRFKWLDSHFFTTKCFEKFGKSNCKTEQVFTLFSCSLFAPNTLIQLHRKVVSVVTEEQSTSPATHCASSAARNPLRTRCEFCAFQRSYRNTI
jgi:hypothetical protein